MAESDTVEVEARVAIAGLPAGGVGPIPRRLAEMAEVLGYVVRIDRLSSRRPSAVVERTISTAMASGTVDADEVGTTINPWDHDHPSLGGI